MTTKAVAGVRHRNSKTSGDYPIFGKFSKEAESEDMYWAHYFAGLVNGKFPKGVSVRENFLIYRNKKKTQQIEIPVPQDWKIVAEFFRTNCEQLSTKDWDERKDKEKEIVSLTTSQLNVKKRKERVSTIPVYVLEMSKKYELTRPEMLDLESLVRYHFNSRTFRDGDVTYGPSGNIKDISVVIFDPESRLFTVSREPRAAREARENYIPTFDYLFGLKTIKKNEKRLSFDDEMRKYLKLVYGNNALIGPAASEVHSIAPSVAEHAGVLAELDED